MPLLGQGGNDGSRDFGVNFGNALNSLFDLTTGGPKDNTAMYVRASLCGDPIPGLGAGNPGQYQPGAVGENTSCGFIGELPYNPFDLILLLEGAMLFSGATTRRLGSEAEGAGFPFTVRALTVGSGAAAAPDDAGFWEFWGPIWPRAATLGELSALLREGRATIVGRTARDGLEFAAAVHRLGTQRGISEFQRYALLQREPRYPRKATPLGRVSVRENPRASLISDLDANDWLRRARRAVRDKDAPAVLLALGRRLDEALFRLAAEDSPEAVQEALVAIGALAFEVGRRPRLHENLPPPPRLSSSWVEAADDESHEFALAAALASLDATTREESRTPGFDLPFRRHLGPLAGLEGTRKWDDQSTESQTLAVWTGRNLVRDLAAILERRLTEAHRHSFVYQGRPELPLRERRAAPLAAVAAFLAGRTDDARIAALAAGLAWAHTWSAGRSARERQDPLPFAYAALKPLFDPRGLGLDDEVRRSIGPLPVVRLLRAERVRDAVSLAQRLLRAAGLPAPFAALNPTSAGDPTRLAAALLFPIAPAAYDRLIMRAYPDMTRKEDSDDA